MTAHRTLGQARATRFIRALTDLFDPARCGERSLAIVYGSYAYELARDHSDVDAVVLTATMPDAGRRALVESIVRFHRVWGLALDDEVPFERKVVADWRDVDVAVSGDCFPVQNGRRHATPVSKTREFLCSEETRLRLLLNALTGRCVQLTGDPALLAGLQNRARQCWFRVLPELVPMPAEWTIGEFVDALVGRPPHDGEMFLGFKPHPTIRAYLVSAFAAAAEDGLKSRVLIRRGDRYSVG